MAKLLAMEQTTAIRPGTIRPRHLLTVATVAIVVIGCLAVLSAADGASSGSAFAYFAKASVLGTAGLLLMVYLGRGGRKGNGGLAMAHRFSTILLGIGFVGVLFVMVPTPLTPEINGARQWISLGPITIQPSEILKPALVLYLAASLARQPWRTESLHALRPILGVAVAGLGVVAAQDLGSALVTGGIVMSMFFIAGVPGRMLGLLSGAAVAGAAMLTLIAPERVSRMTVFLHPFEDRFDAGFQITNGLMAIGQGGVFGSGIGESLQKHIMPEPQTDFILPVIMEEVGLLGATVIMVLYVAIVLLGLRIARSTQDPYERLVAAGLSSIMLWQAALNIWVVLGIAPLTGVPLPLVSAGSTSQLLILGAIGLLIDIDRRSATPTVALVVAEERPAPVRRERPVPAPVVEPVRGVPLPLVCAGSTCELLMLGAFVLLIDMDRRSDTRTVALV
ncbi:MAG: FtsW/RodA/SpoVE family cell cycle protein, partial [Solirubrobacteraceae bacterium]|nr:FtsW/RodA/SpoVE family cell cycle protein [Solirubrobacteraceae bacterium]